MNLMPCLSAACRVGWQMLMRDDLVVVVKVDGRVHSELN
jgi:hypothetical protein